MTHSRARVLMSVALVAGFIAVANAQEWKTKSPTAADWAAMAKLPDFNGVWEAGRPPGAAPPPGRAAGGAAAPAAGRGRAGGARPPDRN